LLLLLAVVLLPTACLLWMMSRAIDNERSAVRQVLADACRGHLIRLEKSWDEHWQAKATELDRVAVGKPAQQRFADVVYMRLADSAVYYDNQGRPVYPAASLPPAEQPADLPGWARASELEFTPAKTPAEQERRFLGAAKAYAALAKDADVNLAARALQAQARCLAKAGRNYEAIDVLTGPLADKRFRHAVDAAGRLIVADAELRALQLIGKRPSPQVWTKLNNLCPDLNWRLRDYSDPLLSSSQRLFLMQSLEPLDPIYGIVDFPTLLAEELAARFVESGTAIGGKSVLQPSGIPGVWQFASASGHTVALFREKTINRDLGELAAKENLPTGVRIELLPPDRTVDLSSFLHVLPAGDRMPGWQLGLTWNDEQLVNATAHGRIAGYMLTGLLAVATAAGLALWIAIRFLRQMRLTRLKNDLVATVSHELKTPLTSIRLLVDTLLSGYTEPACGAGVSPAGASGAGVSPASTAGTAAPQNVREYLELIAKENAQLSRLIDNFLTFSRMERNKRAFSFSPIAPAAIVASAADAVRERFQQSGCRFDVQVEPDLPPVNADADAMTTALVNLLDNAWKYTEADKQISLRAYGDDGRVSLAVSDNGIGLSRAACKKVFERFYQVDRELSRSRGGCGLGLSIVEFIVKGHGGDVTVRSRPGQGSTFTILLPRAETD
jgi:signal transduction histidine kinase